MGRAVAQNEARLRGAAREISDVGDSLERVEMVESRVERDLKSLLHAFKRNKTVSQEESSLALILGEHLSNMRRDLGSLVTTINATRSALVEAREAVASTERDLEEARLAERRARIAERLRDGKATVDYETGEVSTLLSPSERRRVGAFLGPNANLSRIEAELLAGSLGLGTSLSESGTIEFTSGNAERFGALGKDASEGGGGGSNRGAKRFDRERLRADPAMLHLDTRFLQDMVVLSLSTAIGGLCAAWLGAPHTLGYMLGGVLVGPSCLDLIRNLEQAETLAQFGSIFLLFSHGLMYSHYYELRKRKKRSRASANNNAINDTASTTGISTNEHDQEQIENDVQDTLPASSTTNQTPVPARAVSSGFLLVAGLGSALWASMRFVGLAANPSEAALYSAAFSLSSSAAVLASLRDARLEDTVFGHTLVELLSVQDLVLAPLLALPTAISEFGAKKNKAPLTAAYEALWLAASYCLTAALVIVAVRTLLPRALGALGGTTQLPPTGASSNASPPMKLASVIDPIESSTGANASLDQAQTDGWHTRRPHHRTTGSDKRAVTTTTENPLAPSPRSSMSTTSWQPVSRRAAKDASFGLCVVGYALAMALLADRLKLSHEAGALFAGLVLVGTPQVDRAKRAVEPLTSLFGGMYVASLGLVASPRYLRAHSGPLFMRVSAVLGLKLAIVSTVVSGLGFSRLASLAAGTVLAQVSELALFVNARAHRLHLVDRGTYLDVLSTTVILLAIAPLSVHFLRRLDTHHFIQLHRAPGFLPGSLLLLFGGRYSSVDGPLGGGPDANDKTTGPAASADDSDDRSYFFKFLSSLCSPFRLIYAFFCGQRRFSFTKKR